MVTNNWIDNIFSNSLKLPTNMFDCILESSKLGMRKPDPEIYRIACQKMGVSPHEVCVYRPHYLCMYCIVGNFFLLCKLLLRQNLALRIKFRSF